MNGRDTKGQFAAGNPGGPGRPSRQTEAAYLHQLKDVCSLEVWREIVIQIVEDAKNGNAKSVQFLSRYLLASPPSLSDLAVWEEAGYDPIEKKVSDCKLHKRLGI